MGKHGPTKADRAVGMNIRQYRLQRNLSQTELADHLDLTFQQVQKYEKGTNRVGAGRLIKIAAFLGCSTEQLLAQPDEVAGQVAHDPLRDLGQTRLGLELARAFSFIESYDHRETLVKVARAMAGDNLRRPPVTRHEAKQDRAPQSAVGNDSHPLAQTHAQNAARPNLHGAGRARPGS